jgi:hypothetical protein
MKLADIAQALKESKTEDETPAKAPSPDGNQVTGAQAAKILGVSMARIRQYKADGKLSAAREPEPGSRDSWYKLTDVERLKSEQGEDGELERTGRPEGSTEDKSKSKED